MTGGVTRAFDAMTAATPICKTCLRDPARMNSAVAECSHLGCPYRRRAWSEQAPEPPRWHEEDQRRPLFDERNE